MNTEKHAAQTFKVGGDLPRSPAEIENPGQLFSVGL